jgi:hypothetical protein
VQHRGDAQSAADLLEAGPGHLDGLGHLEAGLGRGHRDTAGIHHQDVVFDETPGEGGVVVVVEDLGVVAAHDADGAADLARLDGLDERSGVPPRAPTMVSTEKPPTACWGSTGMKTSLRLAKFSTASLTTSKALSRALSG